MTKYLGEKGTNEIIEKINEMNDTLNTIPQNVPIIFNLMEFPDDLMRILNGINQIGAATGYLSDNFHDSLKSRFDTQGYGTVPIFLSYTTGNALMTIPTLVEYTNGHDGDSGVIITCVMGDFELKLKHNVETHKTSYSINVDHTILSIKASYADYDLKIFDVKYVNDDRITIYELMSKSFDNVKKIISYNVCLIFDPYIFYTNKLYCKLLSAEYNADDKIVTCTFVSNEYKYIVKIQPDYTATITSKQL